VCVRVRIFARACVCVRVHVCACVCVRMKDRTEMLKNVKDNVKEC